MGIDRVDAGAVRPGGTVLGVQGLSGGVGASCLSAALARRAVDAGRRVLAVDGGFWGAGLDLLLGLELEPGLRWGDLAGLRGEPDPEALLPALPGDGNLLLLTAGRVPHRDGPERPWSLLAPLAAAVDLVVCDLPSLGSPSQHHWWLACDRLVLVAADAVDTFAAAGATADLVPRSLGVVVRSGPGSMDPESVAVALGLPLLASLGHDKEVAAALDRGAPVGEAGRLARCADRVLAEVGPLTKGAVGA